AAGRATRLGVGLLAVAVAGAGVVMGAAGVVGHPVGLVTVAVFYGLYRLLLVLVDARLQERIDGPARATVTSVAALGTELACFAVYAAWAVGGLALAAALVVLVVAAVPRLLREDVPTAATP
ncbi:MAG: hypothetical protein AVDCRST_MAG79-196, partial [uncultured Thermoleophilia bacterium]